MAIARRYLEPQARESSGVPEAALTITDDAMRELITEYARWGCRLSGYSRLYRAG